MSIVFQCSLSSRVVGTKDDHVTIDRLVFVSVGRFKQFPGYASEIGFDEKTREIFRSILDEQNIENHWTTEIGGRLEIKPSQYLQFIQVCSEQKWVISEFVPFQIIENICSFEKRPRISMDQIQQRLGDELFNQLRLFQRTAIQFAAERKRIYIADEMGCGKTLEAIASCFYHRDKWPVLVLCPSIMRATWKSEIERWLPISEDQVSIVKSLKQAPKAMTPKTTFLIVSYSLLTTPQMIQFLQQIPFGISVMDECHYIKSTDSKRAKGTLQVTNRTDVRIMLSGTPCNYPSELYQQIRALYPKIFLKFFDYGKPDDSTLYFANRYCTPTQIKFGRQTQWVYKGYEKSEELNCLLSGFMLKRRKVDVLPQLPAKNRVCITLDPFTPKIQKEIDKLLKPQQKKPKKPDQKDVVESNPLAYMEAFRATSRHKAEHVIDFIQSHLIHDILKELPDTKFLIFAHHQVMRERIEQCLVKHNISHFSIHKDTSANKRKEYQDAFQETDRYQGAVLSIKAAGVGLTLTKASIVIFAEVMFGPDDMLQAEDRIHRIGQEASQVTYFYLLQPNTTDQSNYYLMLKKERESSLILDGKANHLAHSHVGASYANATQIITKPIGSKRKQHDNQHKPHVPKRFVTIRK